MDKVQRRPNRLVILAPLQRLIVSPLFRRPRKLIRTAPLLLSLLLLLTQNVQDVGNEIAHSTLLQFRKRCDGIKNSLIGAIDIPTNNRGQHRNAALEVAQVCNRRLPAPIVLIHRQYRILRDEQFPLPRLHHPTWQAHLSCRRPIRNRRKRILITRLGWEHHEQKPP